jgi:ribonuclease HII
VGVTVIDRASISGFPKGVRDSKMLSAVARERLFAPLCEAVISFSVGHASSTECDQLGMTRALRLATDRALLGLPIAPDAIILDGVHNYTGRDRVVNLARADQLAVSVAAASVIAKVTRDRIMIEEAENYPGYSFHSNKGYPSPEHLRALSKQGLTAIHRRSWSFAQDYGG